MISGSLLTILKTNGYSYPTKPLTPRQRNPYIAIPKMSGSRIRPMVAASVFTLKARVHAYRTHATCRFHAGYGLLITHHYIHTYLKIPGKYLVINHK